MYFLLYLSISLIFSGLFNIFKFDTKESRGNWEHIAASFTVGLIWPIFILFWTVVFIFSITAYIKYIQTDETNLNKY